MAQSPIIKTMDEMLTKLAEAREAYREAEKSITEYTNAVRALAQVCEDEDVRNEYLTRLEEISGKQGFAEAVRAAMLRGTAMTPMEIRSLIMLRKIMDLSGYSNPMASIHTTLRRMKEKGDVEETTNGKGEKAYRLVLEGQTSGFRRGALAQMMAAQRDKK
jgi:hypothetical protein